jgi:hypothetical protein
MIVWRFVAFHWYAARAWVRGLFWRWPQQAPLPRWAESGVSCGLRSHWEAWGMYRYGWVPWCFQRTRYGTARLFATTRAGREDEAPVGYPDPGDDRDPLGLDELPF